MDTAKPVFKTIADGISKPMKFDHGGYHPANTYYVYLETNNPDYLQEHGFGDNPAMQIKADTIYEAIDHVKRNMPEDAEMSVISSSNVNKAKGGGLYAVGGMIEHGLMVGDTIVDEYKDYGIIKDKSGHFFVYDPNVGERKMINGSVYEQIMLNGKAMIDSMSNTYMRRAGLMKDGGDIEKGNLEMIKSSVKEIKHHAEELESQLKSNPEIEAWVLAKADRASTALSDITHYLDGRTYALGGLTPGRWYRDNENVEYRFIGKVDNGPDKDKLLFTDGDKRMFKSLDEFGGKPKENKLFGFFADGGMMAKGGETLNVKYQENLEKLLTDEGWTLSFFDKYANDVPKEKAVELSLSRFEPQYEVKRIKLPTKKMVTFEWVMDKVSNDNIYKSFAANFKNLLNEKGLVGVNSYPTTYGIGVTQFMDSRISKEKIKNLLDSLGIEYINELSDAEYVYRFRISKSKSNIEKIKKLENKFEMGGKVKFADGGDLKEPISEIIDEEIRVYPETIKKLLNFVGEGIYDMDVESWIPRMSSTYQNEIRIYFSENAWGGISTDEWNKLEKILDQYVGKGGFESYSVNPSSNNLLLEFSDNNYPMGEYDYKMASGGKVPDDAIQSYMKHMIWSLRDKNLILSNKEYYDKKFEEFYKNASNKVKKVLDEHIKEAKKNKLVLFKKGANINIDEDQILVFSETSDNEEGDHHLKTIYKNGNITHEFTRSPKRDAAEQEEYRLQAIKNAPIFRKAKKELKSKFPSLPFSFSLRTSEMNVIVNDVEISWILGKENFILLAVRDGSKVRISKKIGFTENPSEFVSIVSPYVEEYAVMAKGGKIKNKILNLKSKLKK